MNTLPRLRSLSRKAASTVPVLLLSVVTSLAFAAPAAAQTPPPATAPAATPPPTPKDAPKDAPKEAPKDAPKPAAKPADGQAPKTDAKADLEYVVMATSMGDLVIELDRKNAPISVENFLKYVDKEYYNNTIFHRVVPGFVVQGGGFDTNKSQKPTDAPIKNEWQNGLKNKRGTIAMARTNKADSATSQFYINLKDNAPLDAATPRGDNAAYAVFGTVIKGMEVVDKMAASPTGKQMMIPTGGQASPMTDVPTTDIVITSVKRISAADAKK